MSSTPPPPLFAVGERVGDLYEIRALLGQGAMGQVFEADDVRLQRRVAVKANFPDADASVEVEGQALARIRHPSVVAVHAIGRHRGVDFIVMEHVAGVPLSAHLERLASAALGERIAVLTAVAEGLAAIHRAGLAHRDVKPDNVLLAPSGRVVLTDFGLARPDGYIPGEPEVAGTLEYMAPEVISERFENAGWARVDMYAFGMLAFRVLSGRCAFDADDPLSLVFHHTDAAPRTLADVATVPPRLSEIVERVLAKRARDRPPTMDIVVWHLRAAAEHVARFGSMPAPAPPRPLHILVAEADREVESRLVGAILEVLAGADIRVVRDADEALSAFRARPPRLVFLDLLLPGTSGFELFTYLRSTHLARGAIFVVIGQEGSRGDVDLLLELGAYDFIPDGPELRPRARRIVEMMAERHTC